MRNKKRLFSPVRHEIQFFSSLAVTCHQLFLPLLSLTHCDNFILCASLDDNVSRTTYIYEKFIQVSETKHSFLKRKKREFSLFFSAEIAFIRVND